MINGLFRLLFITALTFNLTFAQSNKLDSLLQQVYTNSSIVGMSVAVVKGDSLVFNKGYGLRNVEQKLPVDNNTSFRIASISKAITTITLMTLYDKGMFNLDDDISKYIGFTLRNPLFPNDTITIRQILSHTSSLNDGAGYDNFLSELGKDIFPPLSALLVPGEKHYTADMFQNRSPKSNYFQYANINFGIIGTLIEKLTGKRFDIVARENVLIPLGIDGSYNVQDLSDITNLATLNRMPDSVWVPQADNYTGIKPAPRKLSEYKVGMNGVIFSPTGGLRISTAGLAKIMTLLSKNGIYKNQRILSENATQIMLNTVWKFDGSNGNTLGEVFKNYAFANHTTKDLLKEVELTGHPGDAYGLISDMYFSKAKDFGVVFICNGGKFKAGKHSGWYELEEQVFEAVNDCIEYIK